MLKRDEHGIIVQHNPDYPTYADGGDSAARTGIMAMCGSTEDQSLLALFSTDDWGLVRHPFQPQWNDKTLTSRDQLTQWAAGVGELRKLEYFRSLDDHQIILIEEPELENMIGAALTVNYFSNRWFINKDFLMVDVKLMYRLATKTSVPFWLSLFGYPWTFISLLWTCFIMPSNESNQMIAMLSVHNDWWMKKLRAWHPDLKKSIYDYWATQPFRDQKEIADALWAYVESRTK